MLTIHQTTIHVISKYWAENQDINLHTPIMYVNRCDDPMNCLSVVIFLIFFTISD